MVNTIISQSFYFGSDYGTRAEKESGWENVVGKLWLGNVVEKESCWKLVKSSHYFHNLLLK